MTNAILCPVDLAHEASWKLALPEAVAEARMRSAHLHLLVIVPDPGSMLVAQYLPEDFSARAAEKALADLKALADTHVPAGIETTPHIAHGHPAEQILDFADKLGVSLIVMASHKPDAMRTLFVGSVADKIVHNASHSVLVVRK